nr:ribulose bisphosphate carboxylase small chain, chloroplastic-like [Populus alba]
MKKWNPINNKKFEALSYLTPLSDDSIAKEIDYMMKKGWIPCLEFDDAGSMHREHSRILRWKVLDIVEAPYVWMHRLLISSPP